MFFCKKWLRNHLKYITDIIDIIDVLMLYYVHIEISSSYCFYYVHD